jgi:hypothetical protein
VTDRDDLLARVASGELGAANLVEMVVAEREKNAALADACREWNVRYNALAAAAPEWDEANPNELVELILWLAIPWADNDPLFPESDGWTGVALEANQRMARTWRRVVRGHESPGAVPDEKGEPHGSE